MSAPASVLAIDANARDSQSVFASALPESSLSFAARRRLLSVFSGDAHASLLRTLRHSGPDAFDLSLLNYVARRNNVFFYFNGRQLNRIFSRTYQGTDPYKNNIARADSVLGHRFPPVLGTSTYSVQLAANIDWDAAPKGYGDNFLRTLNRHVYWKDLGIAYRASGDGKYIREMISQLHSWSDQTSALSGPEDWRIAVPAWDLLTTSDRVRNWVYAWQLVLGSPDWTPAANTLFLSRLAEQGEFLYRVTPDSYRKNKTAIHAASLLELGMMFPEFTQGPQWESRGLKMTLECLDAQFYPDGGHIEQSPGYARTTLDSALGNYLLARINGKSLWTKHRRRQLTQSVEALLQLLAPDSKQLPSVSDTYRSSSITPFFATAAIALGSSHFAFVAPQTLEDRLVVDAHPEFGTVFPSPLADLKQIRGDSYVLSDSGYYVMRGGHPSIQVVFDAGPKGYSHGHYDLLSFELAAGFNYVADAGPYAYDDSPHRAYAVSTPAHNTISIDGLNHDAVEGAHNPKIVVDDFTVTDTEVRITAHHYAYQSLTGQPVVGRTLWLDRTPNNAAPVVILIDWIRSDSTHTFTFSLNLNANQANNLGPGQFDAAITKFYPLRVHTLLAVGQTAAVTDITITNAPEEQVAAKRYAVSETANSAVFITLLSGHTAPNNDPNDTTPGTPPASIALDAPLKKGQPIRIALTMPDGAVRHLVFPPPNLAPL